MALHWIFGSSGSGKTHYLYNHIIGLSKEEPSGKYLIIVPEQFTMQTQKDIVMLSEAKGIMNIDVLSFMRLAYRVLSETPALRKPVLLDEGKGMVIRKLLLSHEKEWQSFGNNINRAGFVEEMKSIITEFLQYGIDIDELERLKKETGEKKLLETKLSDLLLLYKYYRSYMEERYISAEEILKLLADYADGSELLKDSIIVLNGFTGFTPIQYMLLSKLLMTAKDVYISVTIDRDADPFMPAKPYDLFYMSKTFIKKCIDIAGKCGVRVCEPVWTGKDDGRIPWRFVNNPDMQKLSANLFRQKVKTGGDSIGNNAIHIYEAENPYEECAFLIWRINSLVRKSGMRYRDIAVITGDMTLYGRLLKERFEDAGIPFFMDYNRSILSNSFIDMVLSLMMIAEQGLLYENVMRFLRNGIVRDYLVFESEMTDELDNYLLATGIRGNNLWNTKWRSTDELNELRIKLTELIMPFVEQMKAAKTVTDYTLALYSFISENRIEDAIDEIAKQYGKNNNPYCKKEYEQIYRIFIGLLEQMTELMGDEELSVKEYKELLKIGITESDVGVIPIGADAVIVGDISRTRLKHIKVLFFAGVNEGIVPKSISGGGFLSDAEREYLETCGAMLAPTARERIFSERFYLYLNATKPSDMLYISYSLRSCKGEEMTPSSFIKQVKDIIGDIQTERDYRNEGVYGKLGTDKGKSYWIRSLREYAAGNEEYGSEECFNILHGRFMGYQDNKTLFESAFYTGESSMISPEAAGLLYSKEIISSISRLEKFGACAFAHFLRYGLLLQERKEYKIDIPDIGNIFHKIIEGFSKRLNAKKISWRALDEAMIKEWTTEIATLVCTEYGDGVMESTGRYSYMKERIIRISESALCALCDHMKAGKFEQMAYEVSFDRITGAASLNYELDNGSMMHLNGKIDRIDICEENDKIYVKIIDYKSGAHVFDAQKLYYGLNLQLSVYLLAAGDVLKNAYPDKTVVPAGILYFHIDDPVFEEDKKRDGAFVMRGPVNEKSPVPYLIDANLGSSETGLYEGAVSDVIKAVVAKDGHFDKRRSDVIPEPYFKYLTSAAKEKMLSFANEIMSGDTSIHPYRLGDEKACTYCEYKAVCGFDAKYKGNSYKKLKPVDEADIWKEWGERYGRK